MLQQEINLCVLLPFLHPEKNKVQSHTQSSVCFTEHPSWVFRSFLLLLPHILMNMLKFPLGCSISFSCGVVRSVICEVESAVPALEAGITYQCWGSWLHRQTSKIEGCGLDFVDRYLTWKITFILKERRKNCSHLCRLSDIIGKRVRKCQGLWCLCSDV